MLVLRGVSRVRGRGVVLDRVDLEAAAGAPAAVVGLGEAEREALVRLLEGADKPAAGTVTVGGRDVRRVRRRRGAIVRVDPAAVKPSGQRVGKLVGAGAAARVGLSSRWAAAVRELDRAERLRLAIALAVAGSPEMILLASPTSQLAPAARGALLADLAGMFAGVGAVVVAVGGAEEARALAGKAVVIVAGRVAQAGPVAEVMAAPASIAVAAAVAAPLLNMVAMTARQGAGVLSDGSVFQPPEGVALPAAGACTLAFYPDDVALERRDAASVRFVVRASGEETGSSGRRYARVRFADAAWLTPMPAQPPAPGMMMNAFVDRARLMVFDAAGNAVR